MTYFENHQKAFNQLKEKNSEIEERDFYELINEIKYDTEYLFEQAEKHPKYNFVPTEEVPASIELDKLEKLIKKIEKFVKGTREYDAETELDRMFPDRHDEDFDEDSMNYDSVFGGD
ncbi:hypothetical protein H0I29_01255 [Polaribacter sp. R2A056_3_33]|jgi:hypothetical protein|uniref:hypothetical protein n=1 Tax=Polaribacter sp. R2A056_3_33 TaxID=2745563 RepID=UPI001C4E9175|nr:hypothetical protein [Polaribacter sp. R2A056_3_33]QXP70752.1 hypothetical protein H0I29_01255 [Polaribacter sp. R2A056_3_33]